MVGCVMIFFLHLKNQKKIQIWFYGQQGWDHPLLYWENFKKAIGEIGLNLYMLSYIFTFNILYRLNIVEFLVHCINLT